MSRPELFPRRARRGFTLVETVTALSIFSLALTGILAALMQSRRLTEGSVMQNSAVTIVQGYMEQMKNMELTQLLGSANTDGTINTDLNNNPILSTASSYTIPTRRDETTLDTLTAIPIAAGSTQTPPALSSLTPGVTPSGLVDNLRTFDVAKDYTARTLTSTDTTTTAATAQVSCSTLWPKARNYPTDPATNAVLTAGKTDLHLNLWVWVQDLGGSTANATKVYGIVVIYTWQYLDGGRIKYMQGTVRSIRSVVPTF